MYNIITKQKNNTTLYTVVFTTNVDGWNQLQLPLCQSYDYNECQFYIDMKEQGKELYDECGFNYRDKSPYYDNKS